MTLGEEIILHQPTQISSRVLYFYLIRRHS